MEVEIWSRRKPRTERDIGRKAWITLDEETGHIKLYRETSLSTAAATGMRCRDRDHAIAYAEQWLEHGP